MDDPAFDDRYVLYFDFLGTRAAATGWPARSTAMGDEPNSLIGVFIDHNVRHLLFDLRLDLAAELVRAAVARA